MHKYGLDKTKIGNIKAYVANWSILMKSTNLIIHRDCSTYSSSPKNPHDDLSHFELKYDAFFSTLSLRKQSSSSFDCTLQPIFHSDETANLYPLYLHELYDALKDLTAHVLLQYGILLIFSDAELISMEYNVTFSLLHSFETYDYVLTTLYEVVTHTDKKLLAHKFDNMTTGFYCISKKETFKFYFKSQQLDDIYGIKTSDTILRLEWTLKNKTQIQRNFKTCKLKELKDSLFKIAFINRVRLLFIEPFTAYINQSESNLIKSLTLYKQSKGRNYITHTLLLIQSQDSKPPCLFDNSIFLKALKVVEKGNSNLGKKTQIALRLLPPSHSENLKLINEIFENLQ